MGLTDLFRRRQSVVLGPRQFSLAIAGHGVLARPVLPASIAHLVDGTLVCGPYDLAQARADGVVRTLAIQAGTPPTRAFVKHAMSESSIVTYSTEERGTTQLVLGTGMHSYDDLLVSFGPTAGRSAWTIVVDDHEVLWPAGFTLRASGDLAAEHGPYELRLDGSPTNVIQLYGPLVGDRIPPPELLNTVGQTRIDAATVAGAHGKVTTYTFEGDATAQRYYYVPLAGSAIYLVRARCDIAAAPLLLAGADQIARSLRLRSP